MLCGLLTDEWTDRQTDTKVNIEDTLSGFQHFFLQSIIKDRSNLQSSILLYVYMGMKLTNKQPVDTLSEMSIEGILERASNNTAAHVLLTCG